MQKSTFPLSNLFMLAVFLFAQGCVSPSEKQITNVADFLKLSPQEIVVQPTAFFSDSALLNDPWSFKILGNTLIVLDRDSSTFCNLIDLHSKKLLGRFLRAGKGPGEFMYPTLIKKTEQQLLVFEADRKAVYTFTLDSILAQKTSAPKKQILQLESEDDYCYGLLPLPVGYLAVGAFQGKRFQFLDSLGCFVQSFGNYPKIESKIQVNNTHLGYVFGTNGGIAFSPNTSKLLTSSAVGLELFEAGHNKKDVAELSYQWFIPTIHSAEIREGRLSVTQEGNDYPYGSAAAVALENFVFVNYSTLTLEDFRRGASNEINYLLVVNWEGKLVCTLKLSHAISPTLELAPDRKHLLSIQVDEATGFKRIVQIPIPPEFTEQSNQ